MQFDAPSFLVFLPIALVLYHLSTSSYRLQNLIVVVASAVFYGWFEWKLCFLMFGYGAVGYVFGRWIHATPNPQGPERRWILRGGVALLLAGLGIFKYFDFFRENAEALLSSIGLTPSWPILEILLPIGISFYCLQSIAYVVDVHRGLIEPERDFITFLAYMFFFPQLIAGPIERAEHLLVQFRAPRRLTRTDVHEALWLLLWGFYLKVVAADTLGGFVDVAFEPSAHTTGWVVFEGLVCFTLQVYLDFNAYSLIAKGSARLFGVRLVWNFDRPYWSTSVQEFWRRWHISLSSWLRDYLYIPLGGNRRGSGRSYVNLMVTMLLGGLWHGAAWNFVLWGALHGIGLSVNRAWRRRCSSVRIPSALGWLLTVGLFTASMLFFRSPSLGVVGELLSRCSDWSWKPFDTSAWLAVLIVCAPVFLVEAYQARRGELMAPARAGFLGSSIWAAILIVAVYARFWGTEHRFIYFQF